VGDRHDAAAIRLTLRPQGLLAPLDQPTSTPMGPGRRALVLPGFHAQGSPPGRAGYDYLGNRKTPRAGLSPAGSMLLWAALERRSNDSDLVGAYFAVVLHRALTRPGGARGRRVDDRRRPARGASGAVWPTQGAETPRADRSTQSRAERCDARSQAAALAGSHDARSNLTTPGTPVYARTPLLASVWRRVPSKPKFPL
jgi:hypothetical protein